MYCHVFIITNNIMFLIFLHSFYRYLEMLFKETSVCFVFIIYIDMVQVVFQTLI